MNIHHAKTHLSRLLERVARGEGFVIAKAGKPIAQVMPISDVPIRKANRIGFLEGLGTVPDDFDTMFAEEIEAMFYGRT